MQQRRGLAPLVGAGMAGVAAGSLMLFSLLAQQTTLSPLGPEIVVPRLPSTANRPTVTVPAPQGQVAETPSGPALATIDKLLTSPVPTETGSTGNDGGDNVSSSVLVASIRIDIRTSRPAKGRGPYVGVRPGNLVPGVQEGPSDPLPGPDDPPEPDDQAGPPPDDGGEPPGDGGETGNGPGDDESNDSDEPETDGDDDEPDGGMPDYNGGADEPVGGDLPIDDGGELPIDDGEPSDEPTDDGGDVPPDGGEPSDEPGPGDGSDGAGTDGDNGDGGVIVEDSGDNGETPTPETVDEPSDESAVISPDTDCYTRDPEPGDDALEESEQEHPEGQPSNDG